MKQRSTTPVSKGLATKSALVAAAVMMVMAIPISFGQHVLADRFDDQINALQGEVNGYQAQAAALGAQADTLQNELANLAAQKATIQAQVDLSQAKYDKLVSDIAATEQKIADNKDALGQIIADMYVDGTISPLEMLASSKNIGDYVDQQEYRSSIQSNLSETITKINTLKKQLEDQKKDVERVIADQKSQRDALASKEAEQATLLSETQGQEAAYQQLSSQRNAQISSLRSQQAAAMAAAARANGSSNIGNGSVGGGGYPGSWANAEQDTIIDNWALYNRECVSYTAWKVASTGRYVPNFAGAGNANQWPSTAASHGIPSGSQPVAGSVAIWYIGQYGHAMYVEAVNGDGSITVSDYNNNSDGGGWGKYHYYARPSGGLTYIYF
ncbi:CHAP domain-containing protein [Microbacteriaceae bacterium]|nr:CHAP domain-containing protein [Candidatus Saccharibacteria bacterium]